MNLEIIVSLLCLIIGAQAVDNRRFPIGFRFGVATAAYQIEGAWNEDGKSPNIWDTYVHQNPSPVQNNDTGDVACDSYHKYEEDVKLIKDLGVNYYRFSISWPRILPQGTTNYVNQKGVDYYMKIFKLLNESGIEPLVTMYHWDLPESLQDLGGWTNPKMADYFGDYAEFLFKTYGSYVKRWITINEPQSFCIRGLGGLGPTSLMAPGYQMAAEGIYRCAYTIVKSHAKAYHIYQDKYRESQKGQISIVLVTSWPEPASNSEDDIYAQELMLQFFMGLFAHPIYNGDWPSVVKERVAARSKLEGYDHSRLPEFTPEEIDFIKGTSDFFSLNHYTTSVVTYAYNLTYIQPNASFNLDSSIKIVSNFTNCSISSPIICPVPSGFRNLIKWVHEKYNHPEILITENGWPDDGTLNDTGRIDFLQGYLTSVLEAIYEDGIYVSAYTYWSLMDNFEWLMGYTSKFGIVQVDFSSDNRTRTPKSSYNYFKHVIETKSLTDAPAGSVSNYSTSASLLMCALMLVKFII